jgi:DnaJ-class molecular chaperone
MADKDYYKILGVSQGASDAEIKKAYRKLAKQHHPDVNKGDKSSEDRFKDISAAYDTLSDKKKRQEYDMMRTYGGAGFGGGGGEAHGFRGRPDGGFDFSTFTGPGGGGASHGNVHFEYGDLSDLFGDMFGGGVKGGGARTGGGFGGKTRSAPVRGADRTYAMEIDFLDSVRGMTTKIGFEDSHGKAEKINVKIPAGVKTGSKIRLAGKGDPSPSGGASGDLFIEVKVRPHPYFSREGDDIFLQLPITIDEAVNGAQIEVPTVDGKLKMKIPAGTQGGQKFRLKGKGVVHRHDDGHGDQYVVVQLQLPPNLDKESRNLIEEFAKKNSYNPREKLFN